MSGAGAAPTALECPGCGAAIPPDAVNAGGFFACGCKRKLRVEAFSALIRPPERPAAEGAALDGEAGCFYHPAKTAAAVCVGCGRFICPLCEVDLGEGSVCPACVAAGKRKHSIRSLEVSRTNYGQIALTLAVVPAFTLFLTLLGAPAALFVCVRYWNAPRSLVRPRRTMMILAAILASAELAAWGFFFVGLRK